MIKAVIFKIARKPGVNDSFKLWQPYLKKLGLDIPKEEFFDFWFSGEKLVPDLIEYARKLKKQGLKVFILSNNFKERTNYYRKNFPEIFANIDKAYFSWETGFVKPDPKAYLNILKEHHLEPKECIYIDDSEENIKAAKSLGIITKQHKNSKFTKRFLNRFLNFSSAHS
jgi:putative hydrolase of the HAD superfamily